MPSECAAHLPSAAIPSYANPRMTLGSTFVCRPAFSVLHSGVARTPLWVAEWLTAERVTAARNLVRDDVFHPEPSLPPEARADLSDYVRSGYDRGHLAPSADMASPQDQAESFSLANIAPQAPALNRGAWEQLERSVRARVFAGSVFVITGVVFRGDSIGFLRGRVAVPTEFYKLVYDPAAGQASVFVAENQENGQVVAMEVAAFESTFGIHFNLGEVGFLHLEAARSRQDGSRL